MPTVTSWKLLVYWPIWPYQLSGFFRSPIWLNQFWATNKVRSPSPIWSYQFLRSFRSPIWFYQFSANLWSVADMTITVYFLIFLKHVHQVGWVTYTLHIKQQTDYFYLFIIKPLSKISLVAFWSLTPADIVWYQH